MVGFKELPPNMQPTLGTKMISAGKYSMNKMFKDFTLIRDQGLIKKRSKRTIL